MIASRCSGLAKNVVRTLRDKTIPFVPAKIRRGLWKNTNEQKPERIKQGLYIRREMIIRGSGVKVQNLGDSIIEKRPVMTCSTNTQESDLLGTVSNPGGVNHPELSRGYYPVCATRTHYHLEDFT